MNVSLTPVAVFLYSTQRNGLPGSVGCCKTDVNSWSEVSTVNPCDPVAPHHHEEDSLR